MNYAIQKNRKEGIGLGLSFVLVNFLFREADPASMIDSFLCLCLSKVVNHPQDLSEMDSTRSLLPEVYVVDVSGENGGQDSIQ